MTKEIQLTQGMVALVSDEDYERVSQHKWQAARLGCGKNWYATRTEYNGRRNKKTIYLHRFVLGVPNGVQVDHANGDGLDNTRENLRPCSHAENMRNARKPKTNTSGYKGVTIEKKYGYLQAHICANGKVRYIGTYATIEEAARAYDKAARELHGEFARTNFD